MAVTAALLSSCGGAKTTTAEADKFDYTVEQFADLQILRYKVPEFETDRKSTRLNSSHNA